MLAMTFDRDGGGLVQSPTKRREVVRHLAEKELARRWTCGVRTLERWRAEGRGPRFLILNGRILYRLVDIEAFETERVRRVSEEYRQANVAAIRFSAAYIPVIRMAIVVGFAGVLLLGSYWVLNG